MVGFLADYRCGCDEFCSSFSPDDGRGWQYL